VLDELQQLAEGLADQLQRSVAIDDPQIRLLVHTAHRDETVDRFRVDSVLQMEGGSDVVEWVLSHNIATATSPVRIPANTGLGSIARVCVPVRCQDVLLGYLWLLDAQQSLTEAELDLAVESANAAGQVMFRDRWLDDARRARERDLVRDLLADDQVARAGAVRQLIASDRLPPDGHVSAVSWLVRTWAGEGTDVAIELALQRATRRLAPFRTIWLVRSDATGVVLICARRPPSAQRIHEIAEGIHREFTAVLGDGASIQVGVGPTVTSLDDAARSSGCAHDAVQVGTRIPGFPEVLSWDSLGIYRLLMQLPLDQLRDSAIPPGLAQLIRSEKSGVLIETLETYLDEAGRVPETIERLCVHRTSLYHRLNRIEQATGMSLSNGADRLSLHLGIKLARLTGMHSADD